MARSRSLSPTGPGRSGAPAFSPGRGSVSRAPAAGVSIQGRRLPPGFSAVVQPVPLIAACCVWTRLETVGFLTGFDPRVLASAALLPVTALPWGLPWWSGFSFLPGVEVGTLL